MSKYLWELKLDDCHSSLPERRQKELEELYQNVSKEIEETLKIKSFGIETIGKIIKLDEILNLILLSLSVDVDIIGSTNALLFEFEDAYIGSFTDPTFSFDKFTIASQI